MKRFAKLIGAMLLGAVVFAPMVPQAQVALRTGVIEPNQILAALNQLVIDMNAASGNFINKHLRATGNAPVLSSCGTSPAIVGTDIAGSVTMGTGTPTGCVITFATAYAATPHCVVTWIATPLASQSYATSTTAITLTQTATSSNQVRYICVGQSAG